MESQVKYAKNSFKSLILVAPQKAFFSPSTIKKNIQTKKKTKTKKKQDKIQNNRQENLQFINIVRKKFHGNIFFFFGACL